LCGFAEVGRVVGWGLTVPVVDNSQRAVWVWGASGAELGKHMVFVCVVAAGAVLALSALHHDLDRLGLAWVNPDEAREVLALGIIGVELQVTDQCTVVRAMAGVGPEGNIEDSYSAIGEVGSGLCDCSLQSVSVVGASGHEAHHHLALIGAEGAGGLRLLPVEDGHDGEEVGPWALVGEDREEHPAAIAADVVTGVSLRWELCDYAAGASRAVSEFSWGGRYFGGGVDLRGESRGKQQLFGFTVIGPGNAMKTLH